MEISCSNCTQKKTHKKNTVCCVDESVLLQSLLKTCSHTMVHSPKIFLKKYPPKLFVYCLICLECLLIQLYSMFSNFLKACKFEKKTILKKIIAWCISIFIQLYFIIFANISIRHNTIKSKQQPNCDET